MKKYTGWMILGLAFASFFFQLSVSPQHSLEITMKPALAGSCGSISNTDLRYYCQGNYGSISNNDLRYYGRGNCGSISNGDLRYLCRSGRKYPGTF